VPFAKFATFVTAWGVASMADLLQNEALNDEVPLCLEAYELLWRAKAALRVPDSIVWKDGCVDAWYFSTVDRKVCIGSGRCNMRRLPQHSLAPP